MFPCQWYESVINKKKKKKRKEKKKNDKNPFRIVFPFRKMTLFASDDVGKAFVGN